VQASLLDDGIGRYLGISRRDNRAARDPLAPRAQDLRDRIVYRDNVYYGKLEKGPYCPRGLRASRGSCGLQSCQGRLAGSQTILDDRSVNN
jgi:hypothetical protein